MTSSSQRAQKTIFLIALALIAIGAGLYIAICTKYAPWGFSDSATYLSSARNLAAGKGLGILNPDGSFSPLLIFAPFFSIFLSLFSALKVNLVGTIRVLDILFFSTLVASSGWIFYLLTKSFWSSFWFALLIATTPVLTTAFTSMMSEPLAIVLGLPGFLLLLYAIKQNSPKWMILSAILCGLSLFTRYAFFAFCAAGIFCLLVLSTQTMRKRLMDALKYTLISLAPMAVWIIIQTISKYSLGSRTYSLNFSLKEKLVQFFSQIYSVIKYWLPYRTDMIPGLRAEVFRPVLLVFFLAVILLGLILSFLHRKDPDHRPAWIMVIGLVVLLVFYGAVLLVTFSLSKELISLDDRMLSPMIPVFYGLLLTCAWIIDLKLHPKFAFPILGTVISLFFVIFNYPLIHAYPIETGYYPNGYTSPVWNTNPLLDGEVSLPTDRPLISNAPDILLFYKNQNAYLLSRSATSGGTGISVLDQNGLESMMSEDCAVLVLFEPAKADLYERYADPITSQDIADLQSIYQAAYTSSNGIMLVDNRCKK